MLKRFIYFIYDNIDIISIIIAVIFGLSIAGYTILSACKEPYNPNKQWFIQQSIKEQQQENCQHEWVTTSRYNYLAGRYKVISKCIKCGKEI